MHNYRYFVVALCLLCTAPVVSGIEVTVYHGGDYYKNDTSEVTITFSSGGNLPDGNYVVAAESNLGEIRTHAVQIVDNAVVSGETWVLSGNWFDSASWVFRNYSEGGENAWRCGGDTELTRFIQEVDDANPEQPGFQAPEWFDDLQPLPQSAEIFLIANNSARVIVEGTLVNNSDLRQHLKVEFTPSQSPVTNIVVGAESTKDVYQIVGGIELSGRGYVVKVSNGESWQVIGSGTVPTEFQEYIIQVNNTWDGEEEEEPTPTPTPTPSPTPTPTPGGGPTPYRPGGGGPPVPTPTPNPYPGDGSGGLGMGDMTKDDFYEAVRRGVTDAGNDFADPGVPDEPPDIEEDEERNNGEEFETQAETVLGKFEELRTALQGLKDLEMPDVTTTFGTFSGTFSIGSGPTWDGFTIDLSVFMPIFSWVRQFLLWVAIVYFFWVELGLIRSAFAG